jgi:hypothetical protein
MKGWQVANPWLARYVGCRAGLYFVLLLSLSLERERASRESSLCASQRSLERKVTDQSRGGCWLLQSGIQVEGTTFYFFRL